MGVYTNRIQAPTKTLTSDWIPEDGELFRDEAGNLYMGDNVTASDALDPINADVNGAGVFVGLKYAYSSTTSASGIAAGTFRLDNANFGSATKLYIHDTDELSYDQSDYWDLFTSGTITLHRSSPEGYVTFKVTRMVAQTGYHEFDVTFVGGATSFLNTDEIRMAVTMDAPGVRRIIADISAIETTPIYDFIHVNTLIGEPSLSVEASNSILVLNLSGGFGNGGASCHGFADAANGSNDEVFATRFDAQDSSTVKFITNAGSGVGLMTIMVEVYNL